MDLNSLSLSERNYIITQDNRRYLRELYKQYERKKNKNKIGEYLKTPKFEEVIYEDTFKEQFSTFKRVANISKDLDLNADLSIDTALFKEEAEVSLYNAYEKVINQDYGDYKTQFEALFGLKRELDSYFDDVMVNADEDALKKNRLNTIGSVYKTFKDIADIKEITV